MADNKKVTELSEVQVAVSGDLLYIVQTDADGVSTSVSISKDNLLKSTISGINRLISGQVVWTGTGFTHRSEQLSYEINKVIYFLDGTTITNAVPDGSNPRFDVIFVDASGLGIKEGTPAGSPTVPTLDNPDSEITTNIVLVTNGETTPTGVTLETLYSENLQESGGEWDTSTTAGSRITLNSTVAPINLTLDIKTNSPLGGDTFSFFNTTAITIDSFQNLRQTFLSLGNWKSDWLRISFLDGATEVGWALITPSSLDTKDTATDQEIYVDKGLVVWATGETEFDKVTYEFIDGGGASPTSDVQFQVDLIKIEWGGITTNNEINIIQGEKVILDTTNFSNNLSSADDTAQKAFDTLDDITIGVVADSVGLNEVKDEFKLVLTNATTGATETLDWEAYSGFILTMDEACTFSDSNLPASPDETQITIMLTGDFAATWPTYYNFGGDTYDGTIWNLIAVECKDDTGAAEQVVAIITNLTT